MFAMNSNLGKSISVESSQEAPQEKILAIYGVEIDETTPSEDRNKTKRI
jgi:hypothetical protein